MYRVYSFFSGLSKSTIVHNDHEAHFKIFVREMPELEPVSICLSNLVLNH